MYKILFILAITLSLPIATASTVDFFYPENNTSTIVHYAEGAGYNTTENNTISGNLSVLIIKNQIACDDIIHNPGKAVSQIVGLGIFLFAMLFLVLIFIYLRRVL